MVVTRFAPTTRQVPLVSPRRSGRTTRPLFISRLTTILGAAPVLGFLPRLSDTTTTVCPWSGKVLTADGTMTLAALGRGAERTFNGTSNNLSTPDADSLSFGNGTADTPLSIWWLGNTTDTAAVRDFWSKFDGAAANEWAMRLNGSDLLLLVLQDASAGIQAFRTSNGAITQGSRVLLGVSYNGVGGATAADGIAMYQNGAAFASTATNNASYVAMENLGTAVNVGSRPGGVNWLPGTGAFGMVAGVNASAAQHAAVAVACRQFFGVPL